MYSNVHENPSYMLAFEIKGGGGFKKKSGLSNVFSSIKG